MVVLCDRRWCLCVQVDAVARWLLFAGRARCLLFSKTSGSRGWEEFRLARSPFIFVPAIFLPRVTSPRHRAVISLCDAVISSRDALISSIDQHASRIAPASVAAAPIAPALRPGLATSQYQLS